VVVERERAALVDGGGDIPGEGAGAVRDAHDEHGRLGWVGGGNYR
jgi:hypothetical protein